MKKCCKCEEEKPLTEFYKNSRSKDKLRYSCKSCFKEIVKKRVVRINSSKVKKVNLTDNPNYKKEYAVLNRESIKKRQREYYLKNKESILLKNKEYYLKNKKYINHKNDLRKRNKEKNCDLTKCKNRISDLIRTSIKGKGYSKKSNCYKILGCDYLFFKDYIESQFKIGMNWGNIHLDHIRPISIAKTEKEVLELNHYTNFQPLFIIDNLKKSNKLITKQLRLI